MRCDSEWGWFRAKFVCGSRKMGFCFLKGSVSAKLWVFDFKFVLKFFRSLKVKFYGYVF